VTVRVVIDANIFISYLWSPDDSRGTIVGVFESMGSGRYTLVRSDRLIAEIRDSITSKPKLRARVTDAEVEALIELIDEVSIPFEHDPDAELPPLLRDRKDAYLLEAAQGTNADFLVSGDRDLQALRDEIDRPRIVTPREFLDILEHLPR
jgi:putative PIN family toxin of toxin-antitoxin system